MSPGPRNLGAHVLALLWGFAEATLFFVVPDVQLTFVALRDPRRALVLALWTTSGALLGGGAMYLWASTDPAGARAAVEHVPAISRAMIDASREQFAVRGAWALFLAALTGKPYKLFALHAPGLGYSLAGFLAVSVLPRLARFALSIVIASGLRRSIARKVTDGQARWILAGFWVVLYGLYWTLTAW